MENEAGMLIINRLLTGFTLIGVGLFAALYTYFILKKHVLGKFWGVFLIGVVGATLGQIFDLLHIFSIFERIKEYTSANIILTLFFAFLFIWLYSLVSPGSRNK